MPPGFIRRGSGIMRRVINPGGREHVRPYYEVHREAVGDLLPPWTLVLVAGLGRPQYLVEVEAITAQ
jgi:hypothetical protein